MNKAAPLLCIGNCALDEIRTPEQSALTPGGAALRFASGWALSGLPLQLLTSVGAESVWEQTFSILERNQVHVQNVCKSTHSIHFTTVYDAQRQIVEFQAANTHVAEELVHTVQTMPMQTYDIIHICPFEAQDQTDLIQMARSNNPPVVSSMIHYSSLNDKTRLRYRDILPLLDILFLNDEEARFILDTDDDWTTCGKTLSQSVQQYVFLTLGNKGAAIFSQGTLQETTPAANLAVNDLLGAGDCFAGGAMAGLWMAQTPLFALRCGAIASAFALFDTGHSALLRFISKEPIR